MNGLEAAHPDGGEKSPQRPECSVCSPWEVDGSVGVAVRSMRQVRLEENRHAVDQMSLSHSLLKHCFQVVDRTSRWRL